MKRSANEAEADTGRAQRSAHLVQLFNLIGTDSVSNLVRRAERRHHQSVSWRKTVQAVDTSLGRNTEHKSFPGQSPAQEARCTPRAPGRGQDNKLIGIFNQ